jgi:hypothetical protein
MTAPTSMPPPPAEADPAPDRPPAHGSPVFWAGLVLGWAIMAYGIWGFLSHAHETAPHRTVWWILGSAVAHDALVAPVVTVVGLLIAACLPRWARGPVAAGVAASGIVLAFSYPLLRHFGRRADNPSILPLDYPRNVAVVLSVIWVVAVGALVVRRRTERRGA